MIKLNNNQIKNANAVYSVPLSQFFTNTTFAVLESRIVYKYEGQARTDEILGTSYLLADLDSGAQFTIRVNSPKLVVTQQQIDNTDDMFFVEIPIQETMVIPYEIAYGTAKVTIKAPSVTVVKN